MVLCEITGKETKKPVKIKVGGAILTVDISQKHMGEPVDTQKNNRSHTFRRRLKTETKEEIVDNFQSIVNSELAKRNLNLHQLARMLGIKESTLNKMFSGKIKPDIDVAKKLEKFFEITLVEESEIGNSNSEMENVIIDEEESSSSGLTLGDLIKKAQNKK